jgi:hypothetical protein
MHSMWWRCYITDVIVGCLWEEFWGFYDLHICLFRELQDCEGEFVQCNGETTLQRDRCSSNYLVTKKPIRAWKSQSFTLTSWRKPWVGCSFLRRTCSTAKLWWHPSHYSSAYKHIFSLTGTLFDHTSLHTRGQLNPSSEDAFVCLLKQVLSTNSPPCHKSHWAEFCSLLTLYRWIDFLVSSVTSCIIPSSFPANTNKLTLL